MAIKGVDIDIKKFLLLKNIRSNPALTIKIVHRISNESVEELEKHFNVNKNCSDSYNYVQ